MIGTTLSHYTILDELGRGGMGIVYQARDTTLDRLVVIKCSPAHLTTSSFDTLWFLREALRTSCPGCAFFCGHSKYDAVGWDVKGWFTFTGIHLDEEKIKAATRDGPEGIPDLSRCSRVSGA